MTPPIAVAVVLSGGASSRMGRDKSALPFGAESMLARVVRLAGRAADEVVVCGRRNAAPPGVTVIEDARPGRGPLVALVDAATRLQAPWLLVVACDMPLLRAEVLELVRQAADGHDACAPRLGGRPVPTCAAYRRDRVLAVAPGLIGAGVSSLRGLLEALDTRYLDEADLRRADPDLRSFIPCNTPDEYRQVLALAGASHSGAAPSAVGQSVLERLLAAEAPGGAAPPDPDAWYSRVEHVAETLDIGPGTSVFDASCGAGAFLLPLFENGYRVGGMDAVEGRLSLARQAMPSARFVVGQPIDLDPSEPWDVVVASHGFAGCQGPDDVRGAVARLVAKATHAVAVLGLSEEGAPGEPAVPKAWLLRMLAEQGVTAVQFEDDGDGRYRLFARC